MLCNFSGEYRQEERCGRHVQWSGRKRRPARLKGVVVLAILRYLNRMDRMVGAVVNLGEGLNEEGGVLGKPFGKRVDCDEIRGAASGGGRRRLGEVKCVSGRGKTREGGRAIESKGEGREGRKGGRAGWARLAGGGSGNNV